MTPSKGHGDLHNQIEILNKQLSATPNNTTILLKRANLHREHHAFDKAKLDLARIAKITPQSDTLIFLQAKVAADQENWPRAMSYLDRYLKLSPDHAEGHYMRALAHQNLGLSKEAVIDFKTAIVAHQSAPASWSILLVKELMTSSRYSEALKMLDSALEKHSRMSELLQTRATVLARLGRPKEAASNYSHLRKIYPTLSMEWWYEESIIWRDSANLRHQKNERPALLQALLSWENLPQKKKDIKSNKLIHKCLQNRINTIDP